MGWLLAWLLLREVRFHLELKSLDLIDFDHKVQKADLVVVGEGRMDLQSLSGKAPVGVAKRTPEKIPVLAICGSLAEDLPAFLVITLKLPSLSYLVLWGSRCTRSC